MNKKETCIWSLCLAGALLMLSTAPVAAGNPEASFRPKEPILPRMAEKSSWKVSVYPDRDEALALASQKESLENLPSDESEKIKVRTISISKDGTTYREVFPLADGSDGEKWVIDDLQVRRDSGGRVLRIMAPSTVYAPDYSDYSRSDFEAVEWVSEANFVGIRKYQNMDVFVFEEDASKRKRTPREEAELMSGMIPVTTMAPAQKCTAYLDVQTQRPVLLDDGETVTTYEYPHSRLERLIPPPKVAQAVELWKKEIKRKTAVPRSP